MLQKLMAGKKVGNVFKAQIKISFILFYYVLTGVMGLVALTYNEAKLGRLGPQLAKHFICESFGSANCPLNLGPAKIFKYLNIVVIFMLSFLPVMVLVFSFDVQAFKKLFKVRVSSDKTRTTKQSSIKQSSINHYDL